MPDTNPHELLLSRQTIVPRSPRNPSLLAGNLTFVALIMGMVFGHKINPGGTFISVFGDIIPFALTVAALGYGIVGLRSSYSSKILEKVGAVIVILFSALVMYLVMFSFCRFWFAPYSRGELFGW